MRSIRSLIAASLAAAVMATAPSALAATARPKNATAQCKDGSYSTAKTSQGACSQHGGVQTWLGANTPAPPPASTRATVPAKRGSTTVPANATAQCKDGTYSTASTKIFACWGHGGINVWMADRAPLPPPMTSNAPASTPNPQNATARCKDGTLSFSKTHSGTCSHHGGVAEWYR